MPHQIDEHALQVNGVRNTLERIKILMFCWCRCHTGSKLDVLKLAVSPIAHSPTKSKDNRSIAKSRSKSKYALSKQVLEALRILAIRLDNPLAKRLPFPSVDFQSPLDLLAGETAVFDAPLGQLLPSVDCHSWVADHDLVEFVGERRAVESRAPVSRNSHLVYDVRKRMGEAEGFGAEWRRRGGRAYLKSDGLSAFSVQ